MTLRVSVVIPALNEERDLPATLDSVLAQREDLVAERLVADGGSRDGTRALVREPFRLVLSEPGRARQLNAALAHCTGDAVLVLHADCLLPRGALELLVEALGDPEVVGGGFHKRFRSAHPLLGSVRWRTATWHALGAVLGDQAQFARRSVLASLGGFRENVGAEDLDLSWRLCREGRLVLLPLEVEVSARRLESRGVLRTWLGWWRIALGQAAGLRMAGAARAMPAVRGISSARDADRGSCES